MAMEHVQSLERGMDILRLLARHPALTATAIARELGVHQSSASRLLASLHRAGFVRKPDFHAFALDYGTLVFAGQALSCFPVVRAASTECNRLQRRQPGFSAAVGILWEDRILYLTRANHDATQKLIDDDEFPPHRSSIGLALVAEQPAVEARALLQNSLQRYGDADNPSTAAAMARRLWTQTRANIRRHGFFYARDMGLNRLNAALTFATDGPTAALAFFGGDGEADVPSPESVRVWLTESVDRIRAQLPTTSRKRTVDE